MDDDEIVSVLNLYSLALDSHSWDLFGEVFAQNVEADYSPEWHWYDLAAFIKGFQELHLPLLGHQHRMSNHRIVRDGDRANSFTYGHFYLRLPPTESEPAGILEGGAYYDDELVRTSSGWRISKRIARVNWLRDKPTDPVFALQDEVAAGRVAYFNALKRQAASR